MSSGLKSKLAHSRLGIASHAAGHQDLRQLTDLINSQKNVQNSYLKVSQDTRKAADSLREWAAAQGDDLNDILPKVSFLFEQLAKAQATFVDHESTFRLHFKSLRTREENFIALRKSKDALASKIDSAERQLAKTSAEHKDRGNREQKLHDLRQEMSGMENDVMNEEARISDFRRDTTREAMGLKLGAMLELSERSTIVAEMARLLVAEVPTVRTVPGQSRAPYIGYQTTEETMQEAQQCLASVVFNPTSNIAPDQRSPATVRDNSMDQMQTDAINSRRTSSFVGSGSDARDTADANDPSRKYSSPLADVTVPPFVPRLSEISRDSQPGLPLPVHAGSTGSLALTARTTQTDNRSSLAYMDQSPESTPAPHSRKRTQNGVSTTLDSAAADLTNVSAAELNQAYPYAEAPPTTQHGSADQPPPISLPYLGYSEEPDSLPADQAPTLPTPQYSSLNIPEVPQLPPLLQEPAAQVQPAPTMTPATLTPQDSSLQTEHRSEKRSSRSGRGSLPIPPGASYTAQPNSLAKSQPALASQSNMPLKQSSRNFDREAAPAYHAGTHYPLDLNDRLSMSLPSAPPRITALDLMDPPPKRATSPTTPTTPTGGRPRLNTRGESNRGDVNLGSRHGYDDPAYRADKDANNLSQVNKFPAAVNPVKTGGKDSGLPPTGYSYQPASRPPMSSYKRAASSSLSNGSAPGQSPAAQIREAYLQQQAVQEEIRRQTERSVEETSAEVPLRATLADSAAKEASPPPAAAVQPLNLMRRDRSGLNSIPTSPLLPQSPSLASMPGDLNASVSSNRYVTSLE